MKKILIAFAVAIATLATEAQGQPRSGGYRQSQQSYDQRTRQSDRGGNRGARSRRSGDDRDQTGSSDQRLLENIESAESAKALRRYLQSAASSRSEEVRMAMVNALESADGCSATDLAYFISDSSEEVADAAFSAWTSILSETRKDQRVRAILETAQILQGQSNGRWQGQGHGVQGPHMAAPGASQWYGAPRPGYGASQGHGAPMTAPGTSQGYGAPMTGPGASQGYGAPMTGPGAAVK